MSHKNNQLINETINELKSMTAFGTSKHNDKKTHSTSDKIYSYVTFENYKRCSVNFVKFCKENYHCKSLNDCRNYIKDYLNYKIDKKYSAYSIKLDACAIAKLYHTSSKTFDVSMPIRHRNNITRSRNECVRDKHFSVAKNSELINFCQNTGLRRSELLNIRKESLVQIDGDYYIKVLNSKGGKDRMVPIINNNIGVIEKFNSTLPCQKVWIKVPNSADIHAMRSDYCNKLYDLLARPIEEIPRNERYYCRNDMRGVVLDKKTMEYVSKALGHERICVIAYSYIRK